MERTPLGLPLPKAGTVIMAMVALPDCIKGGVGGRGWSAEGGGEDERPRSQEVAAVILRSARDERAARPAWWLTGAGETADFEYTPRAKGDLRLEVKTRLSGWIVPVGVRVR